MAAPDTIPLLDADAIARAEALGLHARLVVEGYMAGAHRSPLRGFSVQFAQHRQYAAGDDLRHLDWKVHGRTDRYYVKQYEQETNFVATLLLDASESMSYGSGNLSKLHYAKMMAACLAYLILRQGDAAAVSVFDTRVRQHMRRTNNIGAIGDILELLAAAQATARTNIGAVLHALATQLRRRGMVVLISDLFDDEQAILGGIRHLRFYGHEVIVFHVLDPYELELPFQGMIEFEGLEGSGKVLTRPAELRNSYLRELHAFCQRLRDGCQRNQCHYLLVNTRQPLAEVLGAYLAFRQRSQR